MLRFIDELALDCFLLRRINLFGENMIAGIDVGQKRVVIAYKSNSEMPIFERIKRLDDRKTSIFTSKILLEKGVKAVAFESVESLRTDTRISPNVKRYKETMNIILFLEEFKKILEENEIEAIPVNPRETSKRCPKCNKKLEILNEDIHFLNCPFCNISLNKDEIAAWNILNKGIKKIERKYITNE